MATSIAQLKKWAENELKNGAEMIEQYERQRDDQPHMGDYYTKLISVTLGSQSVFRELLEKINE